MKKVIILVSTWFLIVNLFAIFALNRLNLKSDTAYTWINSNEFSQKQAWDLVSLRVHWDSIWYVDIAKNGYSFKGFDKLSNIVFFPLYPFLIKVLSFATFGNYELAGWIVSTIFLFLAAIYLYKLVKIFHPKIDPILPVLLLLIFPTSFFLNAVYNESLFLFLSIVCIYCARRNKFVCASLFGILASLTKVTGSLLFIAVLFEYLESKNFHPKLDFNLLPIFFIPLGLISFFAFHYFAFGDFTLFFRAEALFGRFFKINADHFQLMSNSAIINFFWDLSYVLLIFVATFFVFKKLRISYGLYMIGSILIPLSTGTFMSIGRYILPLFPLYVLLASIKNEYLRFVINLSSSLLLAMNITLFVNNYWAG